MKVRPIRRREFIKRGAVGSAGLLVSKSLLAADFGKSTLASTENPSDAVLDISDPLAHGFQSPPMAAKPQTYWFWMDGNVTKGGITADLEAMKRIGLAGPYIYNVASQIPAGSVKYMSAEWREMLRFAAEEGQRLGLEIAMHNSPGWSSTGGPWITPDHGMQKIVWTELPLKGPARFNGTIPKPSVQKYGDYYHDIAVIACRTPVEDRTTLRAAKPKISTSTGETAVNLEHPNLVFPPPSNAQPQFILFQFDEPFSARSLFLEYTFPYGEIHCDIQISDDGKEFKPATSTIFRTKGYFTLSFPEVKARYYRILFSGSPTDDTAFHIAAIDLLGGYRLPGWPAKAGFANMDKFDPVWEETFPTGSAYQREQTIDVSALVKEGGNFEWDVPEGDWTIFRFGYAPNGRPNTHPEVPAGYGLEVDKMSREALKAHFDYLIKIIVKDLGPLTGQSFTALLIDSYEVGSQNWTPRFREEFQQQHGYDLIPYLPAFTGRIVDSTEITERFLWDVRRTIADLFARNYYSFFCDLCHQNGLKAAYEAYAGPFSIMDCSAPADLPMGEFWSGGSYLESNPRNRKVISAAHLNGTASIGAEAFTAIFATDRFTMDPYALKGLGDYQFCEGINRFIFHRYAHQALLDKAPGITMGPWGIHFDRTQTWWEQGRAWIEYITRSQYLLQTGRPIADILYFAGEDGGAEARWGKNNTPPILAGYDFEFINVAALLSATVQEDKITLPNGLKFRVLVLPDSPYLSLPVAQKLSELVTAGAVICGPPPTRSPSLDNYPACNDTLRRIVTELWGKMDGKSLTQHAVGRGKVFWGEPLEKILASLNIPRDFAVTTADAEAKIAFKHRATETADIYFVSNQRRQGTKVECKFRVTDRIPELWHADTGVTELAPIYEDANGFITIPMRLDPAESVFVIFRHQAVLEHALAVTCKAETRTTPSTPPIPEFHLTARNDELILNAWVSGEFEIKTSKGRTTHARPSTLPAPIILNDSWDVSFPPKLGAPASISLDQLISLSQHSEPGVRYFSGTATYTKNFSVAANAFTATRDFYLDLGMVKNIAEVKINNARFGILWKPPFRVCITPGLRPGRNHIEVQITNVWANRLIGDEQLPDDCEWISIPGRGMRLKQWPNWLVEAKPRPSQRITFATWKFYDKNDILPDSGLIGPVKIHTVEKIHV